MGKTHGYQTSIHIQLLFYFSCCLCPLKDFCCYIQDKLDDLKIVIFKSYLELNHWSGHDNICEWPSFLSNLPMSQCTGPAQHVVNWEIRRGCTRIKATKEKKANDSGEGRAPLYCPTALSGPQHRGCQFLDNILALPHLFSNMRLQK